MGRWVPGRWVPGRWVPGRWVPGINGTFNAFLNVYVTQRFTERYGGG